MNYLRFLREAKGVKLRKLAHDIGISPTYLSMAERNMCPVNQELVRKVCDKLEEDFIDACRALRVVPDEVANRFFSGHI